MGIHNLTKVIGDNAPNAMKENEIKNFFGRKVAIDASMSIYQFLIAVRQDGSQLANEQGEVTSHLMGMFYRTIRMMENGIKPVYVFDGKPPHLKSGELLKRAERREEAQKNLEVAEELGDAVETDKMNRRLVRVTKEHNDECKRLLRLMGVPCVEAPCEAEAQCAALTKSGKVYAVGTEDMDALTFGANVLLRHLTFSEARKMPIKEFCLDKVLRDMGLNQKEFADLCILLGCDYCDTIRGIGPKKSVDLIKQYRSIDEVVKHIDKTKYPLPEDWQYEQARELFLNPEVTDPELIELKWSEPDEEAIVSFMCSDKGFNEERIRNGIKKIAKARTSSTQGRLDTFFKVSTAVASKRKAEEESSKKKGKAGSFKKPK